MTKILGPTHLTLIEDLGGGEIFQVLVIGDDVYWMHRAIQVVAPDAESLKDREEFFVMNVVIEFGQIIAVCKNVGAAPKMATQSKFASWYRENSFMLYLSN